MKPATLITIILLFLISIAQAARVFLQVHIIANGFEMPFWPSIVACIVTAALAILLWREHRS